MYITKKIFSFLRIIVLNCLILLIFGIVSSFAGGEVVEMGKADYLKILSVKERPAGALLNIQFTVGNDDVNARQFFYRFEWYDQDKFTVGTEEGWKPEIVQGKAARTIQTVAPSSKASFFKLFFIGQENSDPSNPPAPSNTYPIN